MNVGDKISVSIQGSEVAQAEVKEVGDGTATLIIPATRVVMAVRTELAPEVTPEATGTQTIVDEVVRAPEAPANASGDVASQPNPPAPTATNPAPENAVNVGDASKVITSSSVPGPDDAAADKAKFDALDPKVQEQILAIVAQHNAAQAAAAEASGEATE